MVSFVVGVLLLALAGARSSRGGGKLSLLKPLHQRPPKGAVVYLAESKPLRLSYLKRSVGNLCYASRSQPPYPIIFLHNEPASLEAMRKSMKEDYNIHLFCKERAFQWVDVSPFFGFPDGFANSGIKEPYQMPHRSKGGSWGYHHMCRFWNQQVFLVPELNHFDYILRLDTDSLITTPWVSDPFVAMQESGAVYGYKCISPDFPEYVTNMINFTSQYVASHSVEPKFPGFKEYLSSTSSAGGAPLVPMPYTNLEILSLRWFNSPPVARFLNASDGGPLFGIYRHRWGDAPLRAMVLGLFAAEEGVRAISEFEYIHPAG
jgi:hypothetical protein